MEEKERYELKIYAGCESYSITDTKEKQQITLNNVINLLNKQDKRIKELEQENQQLKEQLNYYKGTKLGDFAEEIRQLKQQLAEHNEFFNAFDCKDFNEFKDFISTFMLVPHEEQTLIRELKQQLEEMQNEKNELISKYRYWRGEYYELKQQLHDLPKKIMEELKEKQPNFTENTYGFATKEGWRMCVETLNAILKKYGGEDDLR